MAGKIDRVDVFLVDVPTKFARSDAIQTLVKQETVFVEVFTDDGASGLGFSYTIGTGGRAICALIATDLAPKMIGRDPAFVEAIWKDLFFYTHATAVGAITALALSAIDTALWDLRCKRAGLPLHLMAGGARTAIPCYDTDGGWLQIDIDGLVENAKSAKAKGFGGFKVKVGKPHASEDIERLTAVREAVGPAFEIMTDANQGFTVPEAIRRARLMEPLDVAWFEEPLPAEDLGGFVRLSQSTSLPIATGESIYHPSHIREYLAAGACSIVQAEVPRIGGITPWLKTAHLAETFNMPVCPHYVMELHVGLCCAVPNAQWLEHIPQMDLLLTEPMRIENGMGIPSDQPGLGISWSMEKIERGKTEVHERITA
ncbi:MAG: mandelate racemase [Rhodospirillaceae bacterium]|nr:mandelate racemase [Rhodospirillaceae bacterium]